MTSEIYRPKILEFLHGKSWQTLDQITDHLAETSEIERNVLYRLASRNCKRMFENAEIRKSKKGRIVLYSTEPDFVGLTKDFFQRYYDETRPAGYRVLSSCKFVKVHGDGSISESDPDRAFPVDGMTQEQRFLELCDVLARGGGPKRFWCEGMLDLESSALLYYWYREGFTYKHGNFNEMLIAFLRSARHTGYPSYLDPSTCFYQDRKGRWFLDSRVESRLRISRELAIHPGMDFVPDEIITGARSRAWNIYEAGQKAPAIQEARQVKSEPMPSDLDILEGEAEEFTEEKGERFWGKPT